MDFLLNDEVSISEIDYKIRKNLYKEFKNLPIDFFSKMRHFQPQVGCFNNCSFCSKFSVCKSEFWDERQIRNVISALKYSAKNYTSGDILLAWDRKEHRIGVNYPYLDNDIGNYPYLDKFIELCYKELGIRTRISTVGFSRYNEQLNKVHKNICTSDSLYALAGVRLSVSQYGRAWEDTDASLDEYKKDMINFLEIYKPYYKSFGSGSRKMCVELRYNPLVENCEVIETKYNDYMVIYTGNYLFISNDKNVKIEESHISDPYKHALLLTNTSVKFKEYHVDNINSKEELIKYLDSNFNNMVSIRDRELYLFSNCEGYYYAFNPTITNEGNYGFNIYPKTDKRLNSGYLITERFLLNAIYRFKNSFGLHLREQYINSSWNDVYKVIDMLKDIMKEYEENNKLDKSKYIEEHVLPLVTLYIEALKEAGYSSDCFFDSKFTIDTGTICNLGRAVKLFKGITNTVNEPLTPTHERNYGRYCSTMKQENYVWKLSCGFNDSIVVEKLDLFNTASKKGQTSFRKIINCNEVINEKITDKEDKYFYPGYKG